MESSLLEPTDVGALPTDDVKAERPVEQIDGVFMDVLEPASITQGWGTLQRNKSVWEKPMTIAGKQFARGLGTSSQTRIVYALDGGYRRFQSWVGADGATSPSVTFEVWVDGQKKWESGVMRRDDAAKWTDVDVTGATLTRTGRRRCWRRHYRRPRGLGRCQIASMIVRLLPDSMAAAGGEKDMAQTNQEMASLAFKRNSSRSRPASQDALGSPVHGLHLCSHDRFHPRPCGSLPRLMWTVPRHTRTHASASDSGNPACPRPGIWRTTGCR